MDAGESGSGGGGSGSRGAGAGNGGGLEEEKKPLEGEPKVKRKMKTASQLEILEKTYAEDNYPSEALRAELSVKLGLSDRQLQMWFCHRRLKDRKAPPAKRQRKDASPEPPVGSSVGDWVEMGMSSEVGKEHALVSTPRSSPFRHVDLQKRVVARSGTAIARIGTDMPAMKRYYEPPQAISELRAIAFVSAQLGEPIREDGPILGMEFDPLPPGAFGAPIETVQQKPAGRSFEARLYEHPDVKSIKVVGRTLREYQFLPEQPSVRTETYERAMSSHYYGSSTDLSGSTPLSTGQSFIHANEQAPPTYNAQGQVPSLSLLSQQGKEGHLLPPASGEYDVISRKKSFVDTSVDAHFSAHPIAGVRNSSLPSDRGAAHDEDIAQMERKHKSEEARIAKEVEAHERRIRKELEKQDILRRKREEQIRKEMERQERERRKEEERILREKQREEERFLREQKREMERREKFLQKESIRTEKLRLKEEMRREKEAARLKAANDRAVARRIAKESMELIEDERLELMEIAASRKGLPSMLALDSETLQNLDLFRDIQAAFPPQCVHLKRPFKIQPWSDSDESVGNLLMVWRFLITFADVLGLWPFTLDEFLQALHDYDSRLLGEIHVTLLRSIIKDIEDVARTPSTMIGANQNSASNPGGGHPQIVEGAYAWGFDICSWQRHLNPLTWPEILRQFALSAGFGPKLKKRSVDQAYARDENEGNDGEDIISNLRNGAAAENAVAKMQERGLSNPRRSRHRLTPGTVKFAAFHVLSLEGSRGLTILDVADKIQKSGLRDLTTSKTPEASIAAALSRDTKLFERTAPSTYCVRTPYRKDPADAEAILSAAREKIQVFKNGYFEGEDATDDAEREDAEREEDSDSDVADDPEVDDFGIDLKSNEEAILACEAHKSEAKTCMANGKESLQAKVMGSPLAYLRDSGSKSSLTHSECLKNIKSTGVCGNQSTDVRIQSDETSLDQEDAVIDENSLSEPWVQGLTEGEYSDLSVEERINALIALISVANEGNSIRVALEERLEAANALKKQIWAEAQLDKRRMKEEYVIKMQYSSYIGNKNEQNLSSCAVESRQSSSLALIEKNDSASTNPVSEQEQSGNPQTDLNYPNCTPTEKHLHMQEFPIGPDSTPLQQSVYAAEKSRSQLKAFIGHKAEDMYVYRSLPLGQDRRRNRYWQFMTSRSRNDPGSGRIFVELHDGCWKLIDSEEGFDSLLQSLDVRGIRESYLHYMLQMIEASFKETVKKNMLCTNMGRQIKNEIKKEVFGIIPKPNNGVNEGSPHCASNSDVYEESLSFSIGIGRNEMEKKDALMRYQDFEKWMWEECFNSLILHALKFGKTRCKQLLGTCDYCHNLYLFEDSYHSFHSTSSASFGTISLNEHIAQCKENFRRDPGWTSHCLDSSPLLGVRLLKAQLVAIEASIPAEALNTSWSEDYRKSWGGKLEVASSNEDILQILTLLECCIKRDFLSTNYETTAELLGSYNQPCCTTDDTSSMERVSVLPWIPPTTAAVELRLMELDASIFYVSDQKLDYQKERGGGNFKTPSLKYAVVKIDAESELIGSPLEAGNLQLGSWTDPGIGYISSIRGGQGHRGGRARTRGGKSQRRVIGSRSEAGQRSSTTSILGFGQLPGWKGRTRGRGGRRSHRSARSRQKQEKSVGDITGDGHHIKDIVFDQTPGISGQQDWNSEEIMPVHVEGAENVSSSEYEDDNGQEDNGQVSGYEYNDLMGNDYPNVFNDKSEHSRGVDYSVGVGVGVEEDDVDEEDYDDLGENDEEDDRDVDVEGYIIGESDEGNRDAIDDQMQNLDEGSESSSSDYSD